jgi:hypothetical protein
MSKRILLLRIMASHYESLMIVGLPVSNAMPRNV